jgi:glycosyltransferase involved in cell wall biosynthesis
VSQSSLSPKISVLVPNFNYGHYLAEALGSVLEQTFTDFELIVSDDASTDNSAAIINDFARRDSRIHFTRQPVNLGLTENFNWCLSRARGEYVKFLLADDKLAVPEALQRLVATLEAHPSVMLVSSAAQVIDESSRVSYVRDYFGRDLVEQGQLISRDCILRASNRVGEPSVFAFRRRASGKGFNLAYRYWVDLEFAMRVLDQGDFAYFVEPLAAFRQHPQQQSQQLREEHRQSIEFYQLIVDFAERPWLGQKAARERLFEELYRSENRSPLTEPAMKALNQALDTLGRDGYGAFKLRRKLLRPFQKLGRSLAKRVWRVDRHSPRVDSRA